MREEWGKEGWMKGGKEGGRREGYLVCQSSSGWQFDAESLGELCFYTSDSGASLVLLTDGQGHI